MNRFGFILGFPRKFSVVVLTSIISSSLLVFPLSNASAQVKQAKKYSSIYALKSDFVKAGGQCWEWEMDKKFFDFLTASCDANTRLVYYPKYANTMTEALNLARTTREMKYRVNILVGPNWIINSDQVQLVSKKMGGTLITR